MEGSCLSRLFRPSYEDYAELEADVMYIVGSINQETAITCLQVTLSSDSRIYYKKLYK